VGSNAAGGPSTRRDYQTVFDVVSDGLVIHDPETGEILDVNERFCEMLGYEKCELLSLSIEDLTADDWEPPTSAAENVRRARREGETQFEWCNQRKDGTRFWVEVSLSLVELDGAERVIASIRDISERKERERRIQAVFDHTHQFIGLLEPDGTLVEANRTALEFGGVEREDVVGEPFWECPWWETSAAVRRDLKHAIARAVDGEFVRYDVEVQGVTGTEVIDFSLRPVTDEHGDVVLLVPEGRVITEHRKRKQRLEVFDRVYRHNLRNELSIVDGYAEQIAAACDDDAVEEFADRIQVAGERLDALGSQTREFDQLKRGETQFDRVDAAAVLSSVAADARERWPDATVRVAVADDLEVYTDRRFLELAVENLVENAVEHGDDPVVLSAATTTDGDAVAVRVGDDGPGIPADEVEPVVQASMDQLEHSTGLGLWIVRWSVDEIDGSLAFGRDDGTTATVRLPSDPQ